MNHAEGKGFLLPGGADKMHMDVNDRPRISRR